MGQQLIACTAMLLAGAISATANTCTSLSAGDLNVAVRWSGCGGTYPQNGDSIIVNHAIIQNVPNLILGGSGAPVYGYVDSVTATDAASGGSGYTAGCGGGAITGGTVLNFRVAQTECGVVNGRAVLYLKYKGIYSDLAGIAAGAITSINAIVAAGRTAKGNPTRLHIPGYNWNLGSTQSIVISGTTGAWSGMNGSWTATVTEYGYEGTFFTIPFDSSGLTGTPTGTITVAPGVTAAYSVSTVAGGGTAAAAISASGAASLTLAANTTLRGDVTFQADYGVTGNAVVINPGVTVTVDSTQAAGTPMYRILGTNASQDYRTIYAHCAGNPCRLEAVGNVTGIDAARFGPRIDFEAVTLYRVGDATTPAINVDMGSVHSSYSVVNSMLDTSGRISASLAVPSAAAPFHHDGNVHSSSPAGPERGSG